MKSIKSNRKFIFEFIYPRELYKFFFKSISCRGLYFMCINTCDGHVYQIQKTIIFNLIPEF